MMMFKDKKFLNDNEKNVEFISNEESNEKNNK